MKKIFVISLFLLFFNMIRAQTLDLYHEAFVAYLEYRNIKHDTINVIYKDFIDSTHHQVTTPYLNYISEDDFSKYSSDNNPLIIYGISPITFINGEMHIRVVGYGITMKKEKLLDGNDEISFIVTSGSYVEYKIIMEECGKKRQFKIVSEH